jgi:cytochrome c-type biogenesis protein CcmE
MGRFKLIVASGIIVVAVLYLVIANTGTTARYFLTISELQEMGSSAEGRRLTVSGAILGESIVYEADVPRLSFTIVEVPADPQVVEREGGLARVLEEAVTNPSLPRIDVVYEGVKPDTVQHQAQAIVRGQVDSNGVFHAIEVLTRCPSKYEDGVSSAAGDS